MRLKISLAPHIFSYLFWGPFDFPNAKVFLLVFFCLNGFWFISQNHFVKSFVLDQRRMSTYKIFHSSCEGFSCHRNFDIFDKKRDLWRVSILPTGNKTIEIFIYASRNWVIWYAFEGMWWLEKDYKNACHTFWQGNQKRPCQLVLLAEIQEDQDFSWLTL